MTVRLIQALGAHHTLPFRSTSITTTRGDNTRAADHGQKLSSAKAGCQRHAPSACPSHPSCRRAIRRRTPPAAGSTGKGRLPHLRRFASPRHRSSDASAHAPPIRRGHLRTASLHYRRLFTRFLEIRRLGYAGGTTVPTSRIRRRMSRITVSGLKPKSTRWCRVQPRFIMR